MSSDPEQTGSERVQVGLCSSCGVVIGESDFPNTPTCDECGGELEKATAETREGVRRKTSGEEVTWHV